MKQVYSFMYGSTRICISLFLKIKSKYKVETANEKQNQTNVQGKQKVL